MMENQCIHAWVFMGIRYDDIMFGSSVEFTKYYLYQCNHCEELKIRYEWEGKL